MSDSPVLIAIFGVIGVGSFVSNALLCLLLCRKSVLLKKLHNVLLLTLSIIDMMTGIFIFVTPPFVINNVPVPNGAAGEMFCRLIDSGFILFMLGKSSILIVMCLALERWCSVTRPFAYKVIFTKKRLLIYLLFVFALNILLQSFNLLHTAAKKGKCVYVQGPYNKEAKQALVICYVIVSFCIPTLLTWASFAHIWYRLKTSPNSTCTTEQTRAQQKLLLRMCVLTAALLTVCWLPSQIVFVLEQFDQRSRTSIEHDICVVLPMSNSVVNPWIYFLSNKEYRNEFWSLFSCCITDVQVSPEIQLPRSESQNGGNSEELTLNFLGSVTFM